MAPAAENETLNKKSKMLNPQSSMKHTRSEQLFEQALRWIPGGVNSPVRAFRAVGGKPFFAESAKGAYVHDVDGNAYIDYVCTWGPAIHGHAFAPIIDAV